MSDSTLEWAMLLWMLSLASFWIGFGLGVLTMGRRKRFDPALSWSPPPQWRAHTVHTTGARWVDDG